MTISAVLLAAGTASRFGADKRLALLPGGQCVLAATVSRYRAAGLPCTVVVDDCDQALRPLLDELGADIVTLVGARSGRAGAGMGDSLAAGVAMVAARGEAGCLIGLADMPWVRVDTLVMLADRLRQQAGGTSMVAPLLCSASARQQGGNDGAGSAGRRGHPVGFSASFFAELCALRGDGGARDIVRRHADRLIECPVNDPGVLRDIDTPGDVSAPGCC